MIRILLCYNINIMKEEEKQLINIESKIKRLDDTLAYQQKSLSKKVSEKFFNKELEHVQHRISDLLKEADKVETKIQSVSNHPCISTDRINDNRDHVMEVERSLKKLYIWQAGIGISLLITFLSLGVAAITLVNRIDFTVKNNTEAIQELKRKVEAKDKLSKQDLKDAIKESLKELGD
jgi:hypothetical protein